MYNTLQIHVNFLNLRKILPKHSARQKPDRTSDLAKVQVIWFPKLLF